MAIGAVAQPVHWRRAEEDGRRCGYGADPRWRTAVVRELPRGRGEGVGMGLCGGRRAPSCRVIESVSRHVYLDYVSLCVISRTIIWVVSHCSDTGISYRYAYVRGWMRRCMKEITASYGYVVIALAAAVR